jgi:hypothetical protein
LLAKDPIPVPFTDTELAMVGLAEVDQHAPLAVTDPPPSDVIFPPETAVARAIEVIEAVVRDGSTISFVVNVT